jgi:hypothetical protein
MDPDNIESMDPGMLQGFLLRLLLVVTHVLNGLYNVALYPNSTHMPLKQPNTLLLTLLKSTNVFSIYSCERLNKCMEYLYFRKVVVVTESRRSSTQHIYILRGPSSAAPASSSRRCRRSTRCREDAGEEVVVVDLFGSARPTDVPPTTTPCIPNHSHARRHACRALSPSFGGSKRTRTYAHARTAPTHTYTYPSHDDEFHHPHS